MNKAEQFISGIFNEIFDDNIVHYEEILRANDARGADRYARLSRTLASLDEEGKKAVIGFFNVVAMDTASVIFGTIDGTHFPPGIENDYTLLADDEAVQGDLQDLFLEKAQARNLL